ncbi:MAG TPA: protein kinase [Acidimicrobiales bacterium]|nr:protein kinase [Acidimicrobiales bacterium]
MTNDATIVSGRRVAERYRLADRRPDGTWTAVDETLRRTVVVHLLPSDADPAAKEHFTAEARSLARLNHRNILCTYDTGVDGDGTSYRVDELAAGGALDLDAVADDHRVALALQITQAVADAHDAGLAHGALGSSSVLVDDTGRVQLRGLRLPASDEFDAVKHADIAALTDLIIGLAPAHTSPLRDVAVQWRSHQPDSVRTMFEDVAVIPDDVHATIPPPSKAPATGVPQPRSRRGQFVFTAVIVALVIAAIVIAVVVPSRKSANNFQDELVPIHVTAKSFDPEAKPPTENEALAHFAVDGSAATQWKTELYHSASFGNLKTGVGLILTAEGTNAFDTITLTSPSRGWTVEVYAAAQPASTLGGWGRAIASRKVATGSTTLSLNGTPGGAVLVWITDLGPARQVRISEATVRGRVPK